MELIVCTPVRTASTNYHTVCKSNMVLYYIVPARSSNEDDGRAVRQGDSDLDRHDGAAEADRLANGGSGGISALVSGSGRFVALRVYNHCMYVDRSSQVPWCAYLRLNGDVYLFLTALPFEESDDMDATDAEEELLP